MARSQSIPATDSIWQILLRWRWWLSGIIGVAFAIGRIVESFFLHNASTSQVLFDVAFWGILGGLSIWLSLTWVSRLERTHQAQLERMLRAQQELTQNLQHTNAQLALLSEVNHSLAASTSLDEILDAALHYPQRLVPAKVAALWLYDSTKAILTRVAGADSEELNRLQQRFTAQFITDHPSQIITTSSDPDGIAGVCLRLLIRDGAVPIGWLELYTSGTLSLAEDEQSLLHTIAGEMGEAINGARRRAREERDIYELERAITEERARIARDIHDGLAQSLAFRRMRIDLWLDWIEQDPGRLRQEMIELKSLLREQIAELRRAIFALRPVEFGELGFIGGLNRYIAEFSTQQGWEAQINLSGLSADLSPSLEATFFRIVQEALTNVAKHAQATHINVLCTQSNGGLQLIIGDNGRGFSPGAVGEDSSQLGLRQMRERLNALQGRLTMVSQPNAGTELRVWIPLPRPLSRTVAAQG